VSKSGKPTQPNQAGGTMRRRLDLEYIFRGGISSPTDLSPFTNKEFVVNQNPIALRSSVHSDQSIYRLRRKLSTIFHSYTRVSLIFAAICFLCTSSLYAQWTQVWGGDFPGAAGTTYNHADWWNNVQATAVWGDGTIQNTSDSLQNAYLDGNGDLVIAMTYNPNAAVPYTSARLTSTYAAGPYGRVDARIQNPSAVGMGAAFWALGADAYPAATGPGSSAPSTNGGTPWPWCGELDMMELQASNAQHNGSTIHGGETDSQTSYEYGGLSATVNLTGSATFDNGFHIFTTEWAPYQIQYLLDGVEYGSVNLANIGATDQWEMNQPINFILSSGVGGNGGTPNGVGFPSNLVVNYVNYSQWSAGAPAPVTGLTATATYSNAVNLTWTASSTSGVTYDIYASTTAGTAPSLGTLVAQNVSGTSYMHTGLQPSTIYYYTVVSANFGGESSASNATVTTQAPGNSTGMQLSAGGYAVGTYMNSNFVLGGNTNYHYNVGPPSSLTTVNTAQVTNPAPQTVYNTERWGAAAWTITGLTPLAGYNVRLHFVEFAHTAAGQRNFNVSLNSEQVLTNFDIFGTAGAADTAIAEEFYTQADENGIIEIQTAAGTTGVVDLNPTINAIEIIPATGSNPVGAAPGTTTDLAINSGGAAVGNFVADEDFNGGDVATSTANVTLGSNSAPEAVYLSERYVPFTYVLTDLIADAPYTVNLHFAETYWTGPGDRIFNVVINGKQVLANLDVFKTAGGENIAYDPQFTASADKYGQIIVQFIYGGVDQPFINGIEAVKSGNPPATCSVVPSAPTGLTATATSSSAIGLSWTAVTAPTNCSISSYNVYGSTSSGFAPSSSNLLGSVSGTTFSSTGLTASTPYYFVVEAIDADGTSGESAQATATTQTSGTGSGTEIVAINSGGPAVSNSGGGDVSFVADEDVSGGGTDTSANTITTAGVTNAAPMAVYQSERAGNFTYTIPGLTAGTQYTVLLHFAEFYFTAAGQRVFNVSINGTTVLSNFDIYATVGANKALVEQFTATANSSGQIVIAYTNGSADQPKSSGIEIRGGASASCSTDPSAPTGLMATATSSSSIGLSWTAVTAPANCTISSYNVYRSTTSGFTPSTSNLIASGLTTPSYSNTGLTASATYYYVVEAIDAEGNSAASAQASATTTVATDFVAINSGGPAVSNSGGGDTSFVADEDFSGGGTDTSANTITTAGIANAAPMAVYQSERAGNFTYTIPGLTAGSTHTVLLHFAEFYWTAAGKRVFNVAINGTPVLSNFDIYATAGANKALVEQFTATANSSGQIIITYTNGTADQPKSSGIEIR
jgi:trimeric autotransporter adhesin